MNQYFCSRRELLQRLGGGIAGVAFADLLSRNGLLAQTKSPMAPKPPHFPVKTKAVISIRRNGIAMPTYFAMLKMLCSL